MRARGSGSRDRLRTMQAEEPGCRRGGEENSVCAWGARERIKAGARISLGYSWQAEESMRGPGLSRSDMPSMIGALRAFGANAGAENGCTAPNQALLLTRKTRERVSLTRPLLGVSDCRENLGRRAAERQPLGDGGLRR